MSSAPQRIFAIPSAIRLAYWVSLMICRAQESCPSLLDARARLRLTSGGYEGAPRPFALRSDQRAVISDLESFFTEALPSQTAGRRGRIVLPPRTGKTIIAAHFIGRTRLLTTFIVPTRALVRQTVETLRAVLPRTPVGAYYGEAKSCVPDGANVTTYAMLENGRKPPPAVSDAALIFLDEAHHISTNQRYQTITAAFSPDSVQVGLTATPDYDNERTLHRFFPALVHEMTIERALDLDLLAPLRFWLAEVDAEGSSVCLKAQEYDEVTLGRVMSAGPFFGAAAHFRYAQGNAKHAALIACVSRQQASDLHQFLLVHRPANSPAPALILGETPANEREASLAAYERGDIDTIIQVGVLIEGWTSQRCKILIDLFPSLSRVRATQKFFRVMTRWGDTEARIYMLVPRGLAQVPILPTDLVGAWAPDVYVCGDLIGSKRGRSIPQPVVVSPTPLGKVTVVSRIARQGTLKRQHLEQDSPAAIRRILRSCPDFSPANPCGVYRFRDLFFEHPNFVGSGDALLRCLKVAPRSESYCIFLGRLYPEFSADIWLSAFDSARRSGVLHTRAARPDAPCRADAAHLRNAIRTNIARSPLGDMAAGMRALGDQPVAPTPEDILLAREHWLALGDSVALLEGRRRNMVARHLGLMGWQPQTLGTVSEAHHISTSRLSQLIQQSYWRLREPHRLVRAGKRVTAAPGWLSCSRALSWISRRTEWHSLALPWPVHAVLEILGRFMEPQRPCSTVPIVKRVVEVQHRGHIHTRSHYRLHGRPVGLHQVTNEYHMSGEQALMRQNIVRADVTDDLHLVVVGRGHQLTHFAVLESTGEPARKTLATRAFIARLSHGGASSV